MSRPLSRAAALTTAFVLSPSAAAAAAPAAGAAGPGAGAAGPGVARQVGQATAAPLVLLHGDRVLTGTGPRGGGTVSVLPAPGSSA